MFVDFAYTFSQTSHYSQASQTSHFMRHALFKRLRTHAIALLAKVVLPLLQGNLSLYYYTAEKQ